MDQAELAHIWASQNSTHGKAGEMSFDGVNLYTFATQLGKILAPRVALVNVTSYSTRTARHQCRLWPAISHFAHVFRIGGLDRGRNVLDEISGADVRAYALAQAAECAVKADKARGHRETYFEQAREWVKEANAAREYFNLRSAVVSFDEASLAFLGVTLKKRNAAQEAKRRKAEAQAQAARAREQERNAIACEQEFRLWRMRSDQGNPQAYSRGTQERALGTTRNGFACNAALRLDEDGERVETSQGAQVLVRTVRFLWEFCARARANACPVSGETCARFPRLDHYTAESIDADGNMVAGCHRIAFEEIEGIARALKLPPFNGQPLQPATLPESQEVLS